MTWQFGSGSQRLFIAIILGLFAVVGTGCIGDRGGGPVVVTNNFPFAVSVIVDPDLGGRGTIQPTTTKTMESSGPDGGSVDFVTCYDMNGKKLVDVDQGIGKFSRAASYEITLGPPSAKPVREPGAMMNTHRPAWKSAPETTIVQSGSNSDQSAGPLDTTTLSSAEIWLLVRFWEIQFGIWSTYLVWWQCRRLGGRPVKTTCAMRWAIGIVILVSFALTGPQPTVDSGVWSAAATGDASEIARLAHLGADVNQPDLETPLQIAVAHGHLQAVQTLISLGADVHFRGRYDERPDVTLLQLTEGQSEMIALLRKAGAR